MGEFWPYPVVSRSDCFIQVGNTDADSGTEQGGCGLLGYKANALGLPTITHTNQQVTLECNGTAPFFLVAEVN